MSELSQIAAGFLFERIYNLIVQQVDSSPWIPSEVGKEYQTFLYYLEKARRIIEAQYHKNWLVVLLVDDVDLALTKSENEQLFHNLRHLLTESYFRDHFRLIGAGFKNISALLSPGNPLLKNFQYEYLRILNKEETTELIHFGFPEKDADNNLFTSTTINKLYDLTGGHPYLLQVMLQEIWQLWYRAGYKDIDCQDLADRFFLQHRDFEHWMQELGLAEHVVYQRFLKKFTENDETGAEIPLADLRNNTSPSVMRKIDDAVIVLGCHGVIDISNFNEPRLTNTMFREWYHKNCPIPHIEEVLQGYEEMKIQAAQLPGDSQVEQEVQNALESGLKVIKHFDPDEEGIKREQIVFSLERIASITKTIAETVIAAKVICEIAVKLLGFFGLIVAPFTLF